MTIKTTHWDPAEHLHDEEDMAAYLDATIELAMEDGDTEIVTAALGDIARARGMSQLARDTGLTREGLYKSLSAEGNPEFATVLKVIKALGMTLHVSQDHAATRNASSNSASV